MQISKRRLKEIIAEEMNHLAETGDLNMITEAEKKAFTIILEKLTPKQLEDLGLKRI
jgi:hypothetical protein